jgi:hypothetical protein
MDYDKSTIGYSRTKEPRKNKLVIFMDFGNVNVGQPPSAVQGGEQPRAAAPHEARITNLFFRGSLVLLYPLSP